jgi:hypothetical protein
VYEFAKSGSQRSVRHVRIVRAVIAALAAGLVGVAMSNAAGAAPHRPRVHIVIRGLDNPRGLAFLPNGRLAVAEGGHAGSLCLGPGECGGPTGRIITVNLATGDRQTLAVGFPSIGGPFAPFGLGGLAVQRRRLYAIVGENPQAFGDPSRDCQRDPHFATCVARLRKIISEVGNLYELRSLRTNHGSRTVARVGSFDFRWFSKHPDPGNQSDADPFGLIVRPTGGFYVVDGASNTLGLVNSRGRVSVLAYVPDPAHHKPIYDAAPTCVARTPDGSLIIGTESGSLWRWKNHHLTLLLLGGKVDQVVACVTDAHGNVYLANLDTSAINFIGHPFTGSIVKVTPRLRTSYIVKRLNYPTGMTWGPDGSLYVTINGLCPTDLSLINSQNAPPGACPASGEVVKIEGPKR